MTAKDYYKLPSSSIAFTSQGIIMQGRMRIGTNQGGRKANTRGAVSGWSKASSRRFREWIVFHEEPPDMTPIKVTLTVPGPPLNQADQRKLWDNFKCWVRNNNYCAVWRLEVQERGSQHWHLTLCIPTSELEDPIARALWSTGSHSPLGAAWLRMLNNLPAVDHEMFVPGSGSKSKHSVTVNRGSIYRADRFATKCEILPDDQRRKWKRYMYDHNTKAKQAQIAQGLGRHWGKINAARWVNLKPEVYELTERQRARFCRQLQRLCTGSVKDPRAPFGRRLRGRTRRGTYGRSVWFTDPAIGRRLVEWAKQKQGGGE